jgi:hypothetical protein
MISSAPPARGPGTTNELNPWRSKTISS